MIRSLVVVTLAALTATAVADRDDGWAPSAGSANVNPPPSADPKPAPEVAALGKAISGTFTCKGNLARGDGSSAPFTATLTMKLDLANAWIVTTLVQKGGPLRSTSYRSFEARRKSWIRFELLSTGVYVQQTSEGEKQGQWSWEGNRSIESTLLRQRNFEQKDGNGWKLWEEVLMDPGWTKTYEITCKR
jgi:hypothetical protein